jgi:hypothetical protein
MPTGSSYQVCICANCTGSSPQDVSFNFGPVGGGPCENQYPNACATLEGFYVLHWVYRQNNCEWIGYADSNPCSYAEFVLQLLSDRLKLFLVSGDVIDPSWENLIPDWGEFDCTASHTLTMVTSSTPCSLPSTVTISPLAPSLSSMGDWECATEICPCEPTPVPHRVPSGAATRKWTRRRRGRRIVRASASWDRGKSSVVRASARASSAFAIGAAAIALVPLAEILAHINA